MSFLNEGTSDEIVLYIIDKLLPLIRNVLKEEKRQLFVEESYLDYEEIDKKEKEIRRILEVIEDFEKIKEDIKRYEMSNKDSGGYLAGVFNSTFRDSLLAEKEFYGR